MSDLNEELEYGKELAKQLVKHLRTMGAANLVIPISHYEVSISPEGTQEATKRLTVEVAELRKDSADRLLTKIAACTAHRACRGCEDDQANGKLHGYCIVCGVPWPCEVAQSFIDVAMTKKGDQS